ncbi:type IV pilus twitching motility protein PilT [bacterium]|nr:type IV pilus twitching motility protein PilT [candidate division CSSED10-310 bacterium]
MNLYNLLQTAAEKKASDIHLKVGNYPIMRIDGQLYPVESHKKLTAPGLEELAYRILNDEQRKSFETHREIDVAHSVSGLGRFRVNVYMQRGTVGLVFRVIPTKVATIRELLLPKVLENLAVLPRGLVLCTGSTGSGKTTTLASMVDHINASKTVHIMTIEDPIEYLHQDKKSLVNQREVGCDTDSFAQAMRSALRQDPDVILVGEMRDHATVETALMAAETGHLVLSTLHTTDAVETVNRVISFFEPHHQHQVRIQLASVLRGVISQRLIPRSDGKGRVPAVEVMISTPTIRDCIINPTRTKYIIDAMKQGIAQYGMQTFDQALFFLVKQDLITYQDALERCTNPDEFAMKFTGVQSTSDMAMEKLEETSMADYYDYSSEGQQGQLQNLIDWNQENGS